MRKALSIFGVIGSGAIGSAIGGSCWRRCGWCYWKPVVFGDWFRTRIEKVVEDDD